MLSDTPLVPRLLVQRDGSTALLHGENVWELAEWRLGDSVSLAQASAEQTLAAMQALAEFHQLAHRFSTQSGVVDRRSAPGLQQRAERVEALCRGKLAIALDDLERLGEKSGGILLRNAAEIVQVELPKLKGLLAQSRDASLPVQWCHGDARWENLLFQGNRVTGLIDLGAATVDSVVRDVARLRGDLSEYAIVEPCRLLSAYESIRPLSDAELAALHVFEQCATPLAIANWLVWMAGPDQSLRNNVDRWTAALARLAKLVARFAGKAAV